MDCVPYGHASILLLGEGSEATYFKFLHISDLFASNKQMIFSAIEARFRRIFIRIIAILPGFSFFFQTIQGQGSEISNFQVRERLLRLKTK